MIGLATYTIVLILAEFCNISSLKHLLDLATLAVQLKNSRFAIYAEQHAFPAICPSMKTNWTLYNYECFIGVRSYRKVFRQALLTDRGHKAEHKFCNSYETHQQLITQDSSSK